MAYDKTHILHPANKATIINDITDLLEKHGETIDKAVERSTKQKRTLRISVEIDKSQGRPVISTMFSMVTVDPLKDRRQTQAEDPDQLSIPFDKMEAVTPLEVINPKKKTAKKKAAK
jgi:hypothetical protein